MKDDVKALVAALRDDTKRTNQSQQPKPRGTLLTERHLAARTIEAQQREIEGLKRYRVGQDCCFTMGKVADIGGSHCPIDDPCEKCQTDRLRDDLAEAVKLIASAEGEGVSVLWMDCGARAFLAKQGRGG